MRDAVASAASLARRLEGRVPNAPKLQERSPEKQALTRADTDVQEMVLEALLEHFPHVSLAAEETTERVSAFPDGADARVVIDPIDGTLRSYLEQAGPYAVIVGLAVRGIYRSSLIALPREGLMFDATHGCGAFVQLPGRSRRPVHATSDGRLVLVAHSLPETVVEYLRGRDYDVVRGCGGAVAVAPLIRGVCAGLRHAPAAPGISIRGRVGALIAREAGAVVRGADGQAFPEDMDTPAPSLIVASESVHVAPLEAALAQATSESSARHPLD